MNYNQAKLRQFAIAEPCQFNWGNKEEDLVIWWLHQADKAVDLQTTEGERLIILDAGDHNDGPGPDVLRSRILLDDLEIDGAVEMHTNAKDWYTHGHQNDTAYQKVILHVVANSQSGPDLPTIEVQRSWLGAGGCSANQRLEKTTLKQLAYQRFITKREHFSKLEQKGGGYEPLLLGMIEIVHAGAQRHIELHKSALKMGLTHWPESKRWEGSKQSYPRIINREMLVDKILNSSERFKMKNWQQLEQGSWSDWSPRLERLKRLGLSSTQVREWVVNVLAVQEDIDGGWELWESMPVFRHYGMEKQFITRLGLDGIRTIWEQQGLLAWNKSYCKTYECNDCPLTQPHNTFRQFN